jgi:hypothetical protein
MDPKTLEIEDIPFWRRASITELQLAELRQELALLHQWRSGHPGSEKPFNSGAGSSCLKVVELGEVGSQFYALAHFDFIADSWILQGRRLQEARKPVARWWDLP